MKSGGEGAGGMNGFLLWIQLEEKRTRKGKRVGESFWILFSEKYVYISLVSLSYFFPSPPLPPSSFSSSPFFIPLWFDTRGCIVEKVMV